MNIACHVAQMAEKLTPAFAVIADAMPPTVRGLLVDGREPTSVGTDELLAELKVPSLTGATIMSEPAVLSPRSCAVLRDAVDVKRSESVDTVDGAPEHQLNLSLKELASLVGTEAASVLCALPVEFVRRTGSMSAEDVQVEPHNIFVRRYTGSTRPWNPFHNDRAALTVNVALSDDRAHGGGKLLAILDGQVKRTPDLFATPLQRSSSTSHPTGSAGEVGCSC